MPDWRATLQRAATVSSEAPRHLPALIRLLESVVAGRATVDDVRDGLGTIVDRRPGFVEALDAALRSGRRDQPGLDAARAVLAELPSLLDAIVAIPPLGPAPDSGGGAAAILADMHALERRGPDAGLHETLTCPRCGSRRVEKRHEGEMAEVRCWACGNHDCWKFDLWQGSPEEAVWRAPVRVELTTAFLDYLRTGAVHRRELAAALRAASLRLEGELLERDGWQAGGDWRRVSVGRQPPGDAVPGDVWLDSVEVMPMVLVEAPTYRYAAPTRLMWLAIRPVMRWQFCAFVAAAPIVRRVVQVELPIAPFDPARLAGDEIAPITSITAGEAELYALWFGKVPGARNAWRGAVRTLGDRAASLWMPGLREWTGERCSADEGLRVRIGPDTVDLDADDDDIARREEGAPLRVLVGEAAHELATGMRTACGGELVTVVDDTFRDFESRTLDRVFPR